MFFPLLLPRSPEAAWPRRRLWPAMPVASSWLPISGTMFSVSELSTEEVPQTPARILGRRKQSWREEHFSFLWLRKSALDNYVLLWCWRKILLFLVSAGRRKRMSHSLIEHVLIDHSFTLFAPCGGSRSGLPLGSDPAPLLPFCHMWFVLWSAFDQALRVY